QKEFIRLKVGPEMQVTSEKIDSTVALSESRVRQVISTNGAHVDYNAGTIFGWFQSAYMVNFADLLAHDSSLLNPALVSYIPDGKNPLNFLLGEFDIDGTKTAFFQSSHDMVAVSETVSGQKVSRYSLFQSQLVPLETYSYSYAP